MGSDQRGGGRLEGKVTIITGGLSGIGRAMVERFLAEGAIVTVADLREDVVEAAKEIDERLDGVQVDVAEGEQVEAAVATVVERHGRLDVLCNNAGVSGVPGPLTGIEEEVFDQVIRVNLRGAFLGMKYAIPAMLASGGGSIVNTASGAGLVGFPGYSAYAASKGGVVLMTLTAAAEYSAAGVRVNAICPGATNTEMTAAIMEADAEIREQALGRHPIGRFAEPGEQAAAALFLASDDSSFITGVALPVDGGLVAV
ncbi:MAG TPA: SDR family oxidoreductase [Solirubrobacterales bacterium]|jgi:NAD(P)-dependent dehydrogenase (short-subunit alcohol dehydrogenase family)